MDEQTVDVKTLNGLQTQQGVPVRALVIGPVPIAKAEGGAESRSLSNDSQMSWGAEGLSPPFEPLVLTMLPENSAHLGKCIEAMVVNISGFGYGLKPFMQEGEVPESLLAAIKEEEVRLRNFFNYCNSDGTFLDLLAATRNDLEALGYCGWEVVRTLDGSIAYFSYIPGYQLRLTSRSEFIPCTQKAIHINTDLTRKIVTTNVRKRFRKYIQLDTGGTKPRRVYFKEFGDPREMDWTTGGYETPDNPIPLDKRATELIFWRRQASRTPYGLPRYLGVLLTIYGDRAAQQVNYVTLSNNNIPSMLILVSNGMLTGGSVDRLKDFVQTQIQGNDNFSRFIILEAEPVGVDGADAGTMKLDVKPLSNEQMRDAMFQKYADQNRKDIREAFRLPGIFLGDVEHFNRATADSLRKLADEQIFAPERRRFDEWINSRLMPELGIVYHAYASLGPNVTDAQGVINVMAAGERSGAVTPEIATQILEDVLGRELPPVAGVDPKTPFSIQMAEAVKNLAGPTVGEQVTALKRVTPELGEWVEHLGAFQRLLGEHQHLESLLDALDDAQMKE